MKRIDAPNHVGNQFQDGNQASGISGTVVDASWLNSIQEELANAVEGAGITLDAGDAGQLLEAINYFSDVAQAYAINDAQDKFDALDDKKFITGNITITPSSTITVAHGLAARPELVSLSIVCLTAELGYSVGEEVPVSIIGEWQGQNTTITRGIGCSYDDTNLYINIASNSGQHTNIFIPDRSSSNEVVRGDIAKWRIKGRCLIL